ncbi:MAG: stage II sporulation protein P [Oscillospiraceae bacterium]|nr:stage II sporulation protein P [Oscillospiraceae bacterium]
MRRRRAHKALLAIFCAVVTACSAGVLYLGRPSWDGYWQSGAVLATFFCAPQDAMASLQTFETESDGLEGQAVPVAQTRDENDLSSGFWTIPPDSVAPPPAEETAEMPEGMGPVLETQYGAGSGERFLACGAGTLRNSTELPASEVAAELMQPLPFEVETDSSEPQVLIMHTHATESYQPDDNPWYDPAYTARSTDYEQNMTAVGDELAKVLNEAGINTLHDVTFHDYPSYNGSYERSQRTVEAYLEQYPSIKIVLDVHRDAIEKDGARVKPVVTVNGEKAAQVMIICGADDGTMGMPNYKQNLRFASRLQDAMESRFPGLTRPILFDYRKYNQQLTTGSLLLEVGGHANTLEEAKATARMIGQSLAALLKGA